MSVVRDIFHGQFWRAASQVVLRSSSGKLYFTALELLRHYEVEVANLFIRSPSLFKIPERNGRHKVMYIEEVERVLKVSMSILYKII